MTGPVRPAPAGSAAISESRLAGGSADRPSSRLPDELLESAVSRPTGATAAVAPPPPGADGAPSTAAAPPAAAAMAIYIYIGVLSERSAIVTAANVAVGAPAAASGSADDNGINGTSIEG